MRVVNKLFPPVEKGAIFLLTSDAAETIAIRALAWIGADSEMLGHFMNATGASVDDLRARVGEAEFLASVLDFMLMDDAWIVAFCDANQMPYDSIAPARAALPGGREVNWT